MSCSLEQIQAALEVLWLSGLKRFSGRVVFWIQLGWDSWVASVWVRCSVGFHLECWGLSSSWHSLGIWLSCWVSPANRMCREDFVKVDSHAYRSRGTLLSVRFTEADRVWSLSICVNVLVWSLTVILTRHNCISVWNDYLLNDVFAETTWTLCGKDKFKDKIERNNLQWDSTTSFCFWLNSDVSVKDRSNAKESVTM